MQVINYKKMKKTSIVAFFLMFGLVVQAQAISTEKQVVKTEQTDTVVQGQAGNTAQTSEQNQVMNQGENSQIQTQEQNEIYGIAEDETVEVAEEGGSVVGQQQAGNQNGTASGNQDRTQTQDRIQDQVQDPDKVQQQDKLQTTSSKQMKSQVASAVQAMLSIAEGDATIGQQIRTIAQNQNQNQEKIQKNIENIQSRSSFAKMLIGPNYGEIKDAKKTLEQNKLQIQQLNQIRTQLSNQGDQQMLTEQIKVLEGANQEIENVLNQSQSGFSLFGWFNELIS